MKSSDPLVNEEPVKTDLNCHECGKNFVAEIDFRIEGNHEIVCPHCAHSHFRFIENGVVTDVRWHSGKPTTKVSQRRIWKADGLAIRTSTASEFIRERWINRLT